MLHLKMFGGLFLEMDRRCHYLGSIRRAKAVRAHPFKVQISEWLEWLDIGMGVEPFELPSPAREVAYSIAGPDERRPPAETDGLS
jgi:hypothetical protein